MASFLSLDDYLDASLTQPWIWGGMDCCFFAGNWIAAKTQRDPLEPYRGLYATALAARRLIDARGGLVAMTSLEMERCGFRETTDPDHGDVGVMLLDNRDTEYAVASAALIICNGRWWLARGLDGVVGLEAQPAKVWRIA